MNKEEHEIQSAAVEVLRNAILPRYGNPPLFAIPNGGARHVITGARLKREGVTAGMPDLMLCSVRSNIIEGSQTDCGGLFIEVKTRKGRLQDNQKNMIERLRKEDYVVAVCRSVEEIIDAVASYLQGSYETNKFNG